MALSAAASWRRADHGAGGGADHGAQVAALTTAALDRL